MPSPQGVESAGDARGQPVVVVRTDDPRSASRFAAIKPWGPDPTNRVVLGHATGC